MIEIVQIRALRDNYIYLIHDQDSGATAAVDPAQAEPVLTALDERGWTLTHILNTHHHADHVDGNTSLRKATGCRIYGAERDRARIPGLDVGLRDGERVAVGSCEAEVLAVPGHTVGHIAYHFPSAAALFCGDTLFALGCGRLLGGTAAELWSSLDRLRQLPEATLIFCAHEYTENNGRFALSIEPGNGELAARMGRVRESRRLDQPTVPSRLGEELQTNPFLRAESPEIRRGLKLEDATALTVFTELRRRKDLF